MTMRVLEPVLEEIVDLELVLALSPMCEDDHQWLTNNSRQNPCPACGVIAAALLVQYCPCVPGERPQTLICRPLAEWLSQGGSEVTCSTHHDPRHTKIFWL